MSAAIGVPFQWSYAILQNQKSFRVFLQRFSVMYSDLLAGHPSSLGLIGKDLMIPKC